MMKRPDAVEKNITLFSFMNGAYSAALPMINGSLIQLFLINKGASESQVSLFNTLIYLVMLLATIFASNWTERKANAVKSTRDLLLLQAILYLLFIPSALAHLSAAQTLLIISIAAIIQTVLQAYKSVLDYKMPYQIVPLKKYGSLMFFGTAIIGVIGIVSSFFFSGMVAASLRGNPYLLCMILAAFLLVAAYICSKKLFIYNHAFDDLHGSPMDLKKVIKMLKASNFRSFILPTLLRGITIGITNSMALLAVNMGYGEASVAKLPVMCALGCVVSSLLYRALSSKASISTIGFIGSVLVLSVAFLPKGNSTLFLLLFFVSYTGRMIVDCAIPVMVVGIIDAEIAGAYNAWRTILLNLSSTITVYLVGVLLSRAQSLVLLISGASAYMVSMIMHDHLYKRFKINY